MIQLLLDIAPDARPTLDGFVPGRNVELLAALRGILAGTERERFLYLWGAEGCGRTHLMQAMVEGFRERQLSAAWVQPAQSGEIPPGLESLDCVALDDVERLGAEGQVALFHLFNRLRDSGRGVLLAGGSAAPSRTGLREDLATRLAWGLVYQVHGLSDEEKAQALERHAAARGFALPREVTDWLLRHGRRDLPWLVAVVDALDRHSLQVKRPVTLPLLREIVQASLDLEPRG
ncbi:MAG TPA: DnaA regulatory inactivator Hda [Burkholderiales bacterium]|nr:DnaA regulatory inactivator Hda [Burkholderiales bacterium]